MKLSFYNYEEDNGTNYILYNCRSDELLFLNEDLKKIWLDYSILQLEKIQEIHPEFFDYLVKKGFVVPDSLDEQAAVLSKLQAEDENEETFSIIVNPTLDCNMRCWYCYEKHLANSFMTKEVLDRILKLINAKVANSKLKQFAISFFGGEPLLAFDECVFPLLQEIDKICADANKLFTVSFTSNAFLLNDDMVSKLNSLRLAQPVHWQITLDGGRALHDRTRHTVDKQGTYDTIVGNILRVLAAGMDVLVRLNYQTKSVLSFLDVIDSFKEYASVYSERLSFNFQQVWQDATKCGNDQIKEITLHDLIKSFETAGLSVINDIETPARCYADSPNSIVINYDGNIFKCTAQDFHENNSEGLLDTNGVVHYNAKYSARMNAKYANTDCLSCIIYPLCFGGCSQKHLQNDKGCFRRLDKEGITRFIKERIRNLSGRIK